MSRMFLWLREEGEAVLTDVREGESILQRRTMGRGMRLSLGALVWPSDMRQPSVVTCTLLPLRCILRIMLPWVVTSVQ